MAPPIDGNTYLPFKDMIALEKINETNYRSIALPFAPDSAGRAYGGHVYAQAVWAACQTVKPGFVVHNVTGFFTLAGLTSIPFVYTVKIIRDGRSYCTRIVNVTQAEGKGICFTCTCSFKTPEDGPLDVQQSINLHETYREVLQDKRPHEWEEAPGMDVPWYRHRRAATGHNDAFPGLENTKVDMSAYNELRSPWDRRQLLYYRLIGHLPRNEPNMHACAHLYASDRNSLFIVANHLDVGHTYTQMASLSHTVVFHTQPSQFLMTTAAGAGAEADRPWYCKEDWTTRAAGGRGIHNSRIIGPGGVHVASSWQEGVVRVGEGPNQWERKNSSSNSSSSSKL